jgi:hypothetical protein
MACRYYDDILITKIKRWIPEASNLKVLGPSESKRFFEITADEGKDKPFKLPIISLVRHKDLELLSTVKSPKSYDGLKLLNTSETTLQFNVIPIKLLYDLTIYTKTEEEVDEYVRNFLFKLINNPVIKVKIPYNDAHIEHIANIRVMSNISDTSDITERIFNGQFHCWTIQLEIQDAFLFSLPYRKNWQLYIEENGIESYLELSKLINQEGQAEPLEILFKK